MGALLALPMSGSPIGILKYSAVHPMSIKLHLSIPLHGMTPEFIESFLPTTSLDCFRHF